MPQTAARPLVVFADDWGRHPSSCQHLIGKLLPHREVVWVNTIGTRPPRLDWGTAKRVAGKLKQWGKPSFSRDAESSERSAGPRIVSPKMWPSFKSRFGRSLNRKLLLRSLRPVFASFAQPPNVVTTLPLVADLVGELPAHRWTYYCVDDFSVWPGYDGATMLRMERDLVPKVDEVVAVSDTLMAHVAKLGKPAHLLTHGVDLDHWRNEPGFDDEIPTWADELRELNSRALFWGVIDRRLDLAFVRALSDALTDGTILFVGPQEDPDPELFRIPRVRTLPPFPYRELPELAQRAPALIMPYADLPVTRAMQPLKLKEYLATGRPAVVRALPSTRPWADACDVCETPEAFATKVVERIGEPLPTEQVAARQRLDAEGWAEKAEQFEAWIDGE